jgi:hypothetical protein
MHTAACEASSPAWDSSPGLNARLAAARPNSMHPTTVPRAVRGTARNVPGGHQAVGHSRGLTGETARQPPDRRPAAAGRRSARVGGEQALGYVDDRRIGEPGNRDLDDLGGRLIEVQRAADPGRRLGQPARASPGQARWMITMAPPVCPSLLTGPASGSQCTAKQPSPSRHQPRERRQGL